MTSESGAAAGRRPVLVTGATGTLGREVVRRLVDAGRPVRALSRHPRPSGAPECGWVTGDLSTGEGLDEALDGVGTVVHCATTLGRKDADTTRELTVAARRNGAPHLVFVSIVGVDRVPLPYYRTKLVAERIVEKSGLPWTVLRATQFHELLARMTTGQRRFPVVLTLRGVRFQPVDAGEVAQRLVELALGEPAGRVADMGGPEVWDAEELTGRTLRAYGLRRRIVPLRLPGKIFRGFREGGNLARDHAVGTVTYDDFLAAAGDRRARGA
ncbi:NAD(P)H-binding protein [Streptomyces sp. HNM0574]|uniref:SDR family oxidoreductase n=1 Tax=Streptomyces sp. HNM0574 TaxID=2714954 RepID=UPI00146D6E92|nr:NAD(P)H-binding protein [Streptomyces sp. HNM0574]NLU65717.1 NAD(P)H-binding protein [Streptomyces sp. HNM0574]